MTLNPLIIFFSFILGFILFIFFEYKRFKREFCDPIKKNNCWKYFIELYFKGGL